MLIYHAKYRYNSVSYVFVAVYLW